MLSIKLAPGPAPFVVLISALGLIGVGFAAPEYYVVLIGTAALYGLLAASADLGHGYGGVLNLGAALPFGIGAYASALCQRADLPFILGPLSGGIVAMILMVAFAWLSLSRRRSTIQFALFTLIVSLSFEQIAISAYDQLGGSNGLPNIVTPLGLSMSSYLALVLVFVAIALLALRAMAQGRRGTVLILQRDNPEKAEALGFDPKAIKIAALAASAGVAAGAGALYAPLAGIAFPGMFAALPNLLVLVWVALGGRGTLFGPFLAAAFLTWFQFELGSASADWYLWVLGCVFIAVVALAPRGLWPFRRGAPT